MKYEDKIMEILTLGLVLISIPLAVFGLGVLGAILFIQRDDSKKVG